MLNIQACIFDLDGVITDTADHHFESWKFIASKLDFNLTREDNEQLKGVGRADSLNKICEWANTSIPESDKQRWLHEKNEVYLSLIAGLTEENILPGVMPFLDHLQQHDVQMAIGSSSKNAPFILEKLGLIHRFKVISDGNSVRNSKPSPDVFLNASTQLQIAPAKCMVFEDAASGIQAALAAQMVAVGIGDPQELGQAHLVIKSLEDKTLHDIVEELL